MKSLRILLSFALLSVSAMAFAQSDAHNHAAQSDTQKPGASKSDGPKSDAQKSFDQLKTLAGAWQASVTMDPPMKEMGDGKTVDVSLRVTSRGNALVHEMGETGKDDPTKYDHPVTMEFDFLDVAGNTQYGNMYHAVFTLIDANHHTEDWTFKMKGDKLMHAHMDLQRANPQVATAH
jgi:hypothetical protein